MTGPEHYRAAERLLRAAAAGKHPEYGFSIGHESVAELTARAHAHATLALAAAIALNDHEVGTYLKDLNAWRKVAGAAD